MAERILYGSLEVQIEGESLVDTQSGTLLILGGATCFWADYAKVRTLRTAVMAVNAIGLLVPRRFDYWFSMYPERLEAWNRIKALQYKGEGPIPAPIQISRVVSHSVQWGIQPVSQDLKEFSRRGGEIENSGVVAMLAGLVMGFERILLVGCPSDNSGTLIPMDWTDDDTCHCPADTPPLEHPRSCAVFFLNRRTQPLAVVRDHWARAVERHPLIKERVRSMSGLTRELLGYPEWLAEEVRHAEESKSVCHRHGASQEVA